MTFNQKYLFWFANENVNFRRPEVESILVLFSIEVKWIERSEESPFWVALLKSDDDAFQIASRSVTLRSIIKLWGSGDTLHALHTDIKSHPRDVIETCLDTHNSFSVQVETFNKSLTMKEKVEKIELFNYLPAKGPIRLQDPDVRLYYIEDYGLEANSIPELPYKLYFGVWLCNGQRELINKYSIKKRKFIGNTTMDPQLSFLMANQALVKKGDIVMDPFVGTGSLLVAAGNFGAYVMGTDIDYLMLHGKTRPSRIQHKPRAKDENIYANMKQYGIESQYIDVVIGDSSLPLWHSQLELDSIITDPPYGIREATERIGTTKNYKISDEHLETHIPSKIEYGLTQMYKDLLSFAANHLKLGGRLVSWIPVYKEDYDESKLPSHPCLTLIANSEQVLTGHTSRRLLTWEKHKEVESSCGPTVPEMFPSGFRQHYFGHGETRKQRRARLAQENGLKDFSKVHENESCVVKR
ncbi:UNVERIFIED_CONTAM: hypothetical protein PYX00_003114 [Menopon gallinae]|uniref:tRNA (guanine(10)-N(2))-methyltransferase TRMT11 n=1 Tax=Menopon gallinae TaxID=328185 RepID=A0AAW2HZH1_9NEOP